ncbi:MAG TPA: hypothetical protein VMU59_12895 [Caulobacteraceae bacterium]|nr:hypothetical protein [Caulobacteraceae bacterium]
MRPLIAVVIAAPLALAAVASQAQPAPAWVHKGFENPAGPDVQAAQDFLNTQCRPSGLDGLQAFAIQSGHDQAFNLHFYCRPDQSPTAQYKVTLLTFEKAKFSAPVAALLSNPNVRIGPFYFGNTGKGDGLVVIEKVK